MKTKLTLIGVAALAVLSLTGCVHGAESGEGNVTPEVQVPAETEKLATSSKAFNVMRVEVEGMEGTILTFDMLKDGITYACTTKADARSGVSCTHK